MDNSTLVNKNLYKLFLGIIKYVPNILAVSKIIGLILSYFGITSFALTCFGGTSIILLVIMYLISFIFRFCGLYRISLNYVSLIYILTIIDFYIGIPLDIEALYTLYAFITGVFATIWIWFFYTHRNNPKINHIKQLCDNCC